jgi:hypothetical protein
MGQTQKKRGIRSETALKCILKLELTASVHERRRKVIVEDYTFKASMVAMHSDAQLQSHLLRRRRQKSHGSKASSAKGNKTLSQKPKQKQKSHGQSSNGIVLA